MTDYQLLSKQMDALLQGEHDPIANMSNFSSVIFNNLADINWAGFYRLVEGELLLGPFQGKPGCVHIALGKGVCGTAALNKQTLIVPDVNKFSGHIACDAASISEIVVPLIDKQNKLLGVLDVDSPREGRFSEQDKDGLEGLIVILLSNTRFESAK